LLQQQQQQQQLIQAHVHLQQPRLRQGALFPAMAALALAVSLAAIVWSAQVNICSSCWGFCKQLVRA
jgi:hypothetical protein